MREQTAILAAVLRRVETRLDGLSKQLDEVSAKMDHLVADRLRITLHVAPESESGGDESDTHN